MSEQPSGLNIIHDLYPGKSGSMFKTLMKSLGHIRSYRFFIRQLVKINILTEFKRSFIGLIWLGVRQPETWPQAKRLPFSGAVIWSGIKETVSNRYTRTYMFAAGIMFGAFPTARTATSNNNVYLTWYCLAFDPF